MMSEPLFRLLSTWAAAWSDHALAILWQSALVFALVWPAARLARRQGPVLRRALWALVLIRLVLPADFALPVGIGNLAKPILAERTPAARIHRAVSAPTHDRLPLAAAPLPWSTAPTWTAAGAEAPAPAAPPALPRSSFSFELAAFAIWLAGVLALAVLLLRRHRAIRASVRSAQPVAAGPLRDMFLRCCRRIPPPALFRPTLCLSHDLTTPMVVGIWRPRVIVPQRLLEVCSPEELEALVLHELAHIRQWDLPINCAQLALQVAHWYNPLVWLANRELRRERELACDDRVLLATGLRRREYAAGLLKVLELTPPRLAWSLGALSVAESKTTFRWRIKRIMDGKLKPSPRLTVLALAALLVFGAVVLAAAPYQASSEVPQPEPEQVASPAGEQQPTPRPDPGPSVPLGELASDPQRAAELERIRSQLEAEEQALWEKVTVRSEPLAEQQYPHLLVPPEPRWLTTPEWSVGPELEWGATPDWDVSPDLQYLVPPEPRWLTTPEWSVGPETEWATGIEWSVPPDLSYPTGRDLLFPSIDPIDPLELVVPSDLLGLFDAFATSCWRVAPDHQPASISATDLWDCRDQEARDHLLLGRWKSNVSGVIDGLEVRGVLVNFGPSSTDRKTPLPTGVQVSLVGGASTSVYYQPATRRAYIVGRVRVSPPGIIVENDVIGPDGTPLHLSTPVPPFRDTEH